MKIETEFNVWDEVWVVSWMNDGSDRCEVLGPRTVISISVVFRRGLDEPREYYEIEECIGKWSLDQLFKTREAAEIAAEALNK